MTRISSARIIHIPCPALDLFARGGATFKPAVWRVWVEWWGERQAMEMDCATEDEAARWMSLVIEPMQPTSAELLSLGFRYGGVASHGGASAPPP